MTVLCPSGHSSETTDYCDQCGAPIPAATSTAPVEADSPDVDDADTSPAALQEPCPACGAPRSGDDRYCEGCGHDFLKPQPALAPRWEVVVDADRNQFDRFAVAGLSFPTNFAVRRFTLEGAEIRIGRSRSGGGEPKPEIDLAGAPEDPGVSRLHAMLVQLQDGTYAIRDLGSTNGTTVNDDPDPLGTDSAVPLAEGDRVRVGVWTTITLRQR